MHSRRLLALAIISAIICLAATTQIDLTNQVRGTLPHGNGGTDVTSAGSSGNVLTSNGTSWTSSALGSANLPTEQKTRTCSIVIGANNGSALASGDVGPQNDQCFIPFAATVVEVDLSVDNASSTSTVQVRKRHCSTFTSNTCTAFTTTNLLSGSLTAASTAEAVACARSSTSVACYDGSTNSSGSITVSTTSLAAGDFVEVASGTPDATTKRYSVIINYTVN